MHTQKQHTTLSTSPATICTRFLIVCALSLGSLAGCGGSEPPPTEQEYDYSGPLYAMTRTVYGENPNTYISVSNTLEFSDESIGSGREFPGVTGADAFGGHLFVSDGDGPTISKFDVSSNLQWVDNNEAVSFSRYTADSVDISYDHILLDAQRVMFVYDGTKRVRWNPMQMVIDEELSDVELPALENGFLYFAQANRPPNGSRVVYPIMHHDADWVNYGNDSSLVVCDETTLDIVKVISVPCPGLTIATHDEDGNAYFSGWSVPIPTLKGETAETCVAKVSPDRETVEQIDLRRWTDGRYAGYFRYIGNNKALAVVLHHEYFGVNSPSEISDKDLEKIAVDGAGGEFWKLWLLDTEARTGQQVTGIDVAIVSEVSPYTIDGRTLLAAFYENWGRTRVYELMDDASVVQRLDVSGVITNLIRVR